MHHFLRCGHNPNDIQSTLLMTSKIFGKEKRRQHPFGEVLLDLTEQWIQNSPAVPSMETPQNPSLDYKQYPLQLQDSIQKVLEEQTRIGWDNALIGLLASSWTEIATHGNQPTWDASRRIQRGLKGMYARAQCRWKGRNHALHGSNEQVTAQIYTIESAAIRYYYSRPHLLSIGDRHYCERPLLSILQASPSTRRRWLMRVRQARAQYIKDGRLQTSLVAYFHRTDRNAPNDLSTSTIPRDASAQDNHHADSSTHPSNTQQDQTTGNTTRLRRPTTQQVITRFFPRARPPDPCKAPDTS